MIQWIDGTALILGLSLAALTALFPRFGPGSRQLLCLILPASFSAAVHGFGVKVGLLSQEDSLRFSFAIATVAAGGGYFACSALNRQSKQYLAISACFLAILFSVLLLLIRVPNAQELEIPETYIALGPIGYISSLFLLVLSVVVLANIEQIIRSASETVRWSLKFLFLGIAALYAAIIYISSQILLFPPSSGLLNKGSLALFHAIFIISCVFIAVSWKRGSGGALIAVSHGFIYSSITLLSVGVYLIASSLIARWASQRGDLGLPVEALIFLLSALLLATVLLGTAFRHKTRRWLRRNIFAGRYDYRQYWLEATERIRSIDPPEVVAEALANIVGKAIGAIDISIWVRRWNPTRLHVVKAIGTIPDFLDEEVTGVVEEIINVSEPIATDKLDSLQEEGSMTREFMEKTNASLLVPLVSSDRIIGIVTVGPDRSSRPYDWEAREFLRALAGHAAGEFHKSELLDTLVETKENEAFRSFSTFVLHDLKNFSSTLSLIAQNAARYQSDAEFQKDAFYSVYDTAEKMKRLCNSLRTFSSALAANKKLEDINQIIRTVVDSLNAGLNKHLRLELSKLPLVLVDSEEFERVLQNLLINAREAISEDGTIVVRTANLGDSIEISVEDDGKGIKQEFMEKELFQPFHTTKSEGLGIGLFQSKRIMEAHRGFIHVESVEGIGTKVKLRLPFSKE